LKPNSKFACDTCNDQGEYEVISGYVDHVDSRGGYHGSDQLERIEQCNDCPECGACNVIVGMSGIKDEWGFFHPDGDETDRLYWCSNKCMIGVMMSNYKRITEEL